MARYRKERRARLDAKRIARKREKAWRKKALRERRALPPPDPKRHTLLGRLVRWLRRRLRIFHVIH